MALGDGLWRELVLTPKPGLVDLEDAGSHPDLSFSIMERSVAFVRAYLGDLSRSLGRAERLSAQIALAREAEARMRDLFGTNTHKGALFLGGMVLVARAHTASDDERALRGALGRAAREIEPLLENPGTHGAAARARFGVGGILREVAVGLPSVFEVAVPAFRAALARGEDGDAPSFRMLASLMRVVEDTTALHRCGAEGLATLRADGARLDRTLDERGCRGGAAFLRERNAAYRKANLTMGGVADLLGLAFGWLVYCGELPQLTATSASLRKSGRSP
jgi:triphosphoribosyl-dephospho-CoA synthase